MTVAAERLASTRAPGSSSGRPCQIVHRVLPIHPSARRVALEARSAAGQAFAASIQIDDPEPIAVAEAAVAAWDKCLAPAMRKGHP